MMLSRSLSFLAVLLVGSAVAFAPQQMQQQRMASARMASIQEPDSRNHKNVAASFMAAAFLAANLATAVPALAVSSFDSNVVLDNSVIVSARSGGRAGGRSSASYSRAPSRSSYSSPRPSSTTYRSSTTIVRPMIAPPPVVVSPFGMGYGYNPMGGFGTCVEKEKEREKLCVFVVVVVVVVVFGFDRIRSDQIEWGRTAILVPHSTHPLTHPPFLPPVLSFLRHDANAVSFCIVSILCFPWSNIRGHVGLGYGLGAINNAGNEYRDYRQEGEIQQSKAELEMAKKREAELEARIKALEQGQTPLKDEKAAPASQ